MPTKAIMTRGPEMTKMETSTRISMTMVRITEDDIPLEASKGGMKVGRVKDPLYKDSYLGITPPTFTPPLEPFDTCKP